MGWGGGGGHGHLVGGGGGGFENSLVVGIVLGDGLIVLGLFGSWEKLFLPADRTAHLSDFSL